MDVDAFRKSTALDAPPEGTEGPLAALWHAAKGDWHKAHAIVQDDESKAGAWVHAYLHRVEGDHANAAYWYRKADKSVATMPLDDEWTAISGSLLTLR
ncbi:MAG TPA: hypothetical protein VFK86_04545 [Bauldia sp.]|nr:hypothetical protein [Bauldia sp.]